MHGDLGMTKQIPKDGELARVVLEGRVRYHEGDRYFEVGQRNSNMIHVESDHVLSIEVLAEPIKVGEVIEVERIPELPNESVVKKLSTNRVFRRLDGYWYAADTSDYGFNQRDLMMTNSQFKVLDLPEESE